MIRGVGYDASVAHSLVMCQQLDLQSIGVFSNQHHARVMTETSRYVIITPARNEAQFIEQALKSVVVQSLLPLKWVIVSDGSTDATEEIVNRYTKAYSWIELLKMPERKERHFAGKVHAFNAGYNYLREVNYDVIVSLDADVSFGAEYFSFLLGKLAADPRLGLVGTPFQEASGHIYDYRFVNIEHVSGACQVFRRECFEAIAGYVPVKGGSIDHIAVITARMKGWRTRTFTEMVCLHHRAMGAAHGSILRSGFKLGMKDYAVGNHPLWEVFRTAYQMTKPPIGVRGLALGMGYFWAMLRQLERPVSLDLINFHRREQMQKLKKILIGSGTPSTETLHRSVEPHVGPPTAQ